MTCRTRFLAGLAIAGLSAVCAPPAAAQPIGPRFEVGAQLVTVASGEFDGTDIGVSGRVSWRPTPFFGVEAEIGLYPGDFPDRVPFSRSRVEGLFGVTAGPSRGRIRPFVRLRPGFVAFHEAPRPFACILIFPPPLSCELGAGHTSFALDAGGGAEIQTTPRTFVRVDVGDRLMRYPRFFGHDFRLAAGGGLRF